MFTLDEIIKTTKGALLSGNPGAFVRAVSTDTRKITPESLFIPIKGKNFDGHDFLALAEEKGASVILAEKSWLKSQSGIPGLRSALIEVEDSLQALSALAAYHRRRLNIPVIAITGSNGKTTTKEMTAQILSAKFKVLKSPASFNNHIGVPLSVLELTKEHEVAVLELGMNHSGEIRNLARIAAPNFGIITSVGLAHLEFFSGLSEIICAKCELLEVMDEKSTAIINVDYPELYAQALGYRPRIVNFGIKQNCLYQASNIVAQPDGVAFSLNHQFTFRVNLLGEHNVYNALAAIALGEMMGVSMEQMRDKLRNFKPAALRMQVMNFNGVELIADCYNANPQSMRAAISTLSGYRRGKRRVLVFGDMKELGSKSEQIHAELGEVISGAGINFLVTVGEKSSLTAESAKKNGMSQSSVFNCPDHDAAVEVLKNILKKDDVVLLKGSRGMALEKIIERLKT